MSTKVASEAVHALYAGKSFRKGNTEVRRMPYGLAVMYLHGSAIAALFPNGRLEVSLAGWPTVTTRDRLNALPHVRVHQDQGIQYLNGQPWQGESTTVYEGRRDHPDVANMTKDELDRMEGDRYLQQLKKENQPPRF